MVGSDNYKVYAWHHDGTLVTGWPKITGYDVWSSPALGDIDGDGDIEIVVGSYDNKVYAWHHDGTSVTGWPKITDDWVFSSPALGDIDGDGDIEIVVGSDDYKVYAWHHDGTSVTGWPKITGGYVSSSPALGDIDGDGDIEVVVGSSDYKVYAWDCSGTTGNIEWGTFHHDVKRTGLYAPLPPVPKVISVVTDKTNYTLSETVYVTLEINYSAEYPVVTVLELELKEPCDTPDLLYKSPWFIMTPPVFQWNATVPIHINDSMWVSGGWHSFIATLIEPNTGRVIWKDSACFKIDDLPEKKRVELETP